MHMNLFFSLFLWMWMYVSNIHMWVCFLDGVQSLYKACWDAESAKRSNEQEQHSDSEISALYCGRQVPAITTRAPWQNGEVLYTHKHKEMYNITHGYQHIHIHSYICFSWLCVFGGIYLVISPVLFTFFRCNPFFVRCIKPNNNKVWADIRQASVSLFY